MTPSQVSRRVTGFTRIALAFACVAIAATPALAVTASPTTSTLAITASAGAVTTVSSNTAVTLTATVTASTVPVSSGLVRFCVATAAHCTDINRLGEASLSTSGVATFKFVPGPGTHSYTAAFVGNSTNAGSVSTAQPLTVSGAPTTTTISQSGNTGAYTLQATVTGSGLTSGLAGTVSFLDTSNQNTSLGTASLGTPTTSLVWGTAQSIVTAAQPQSIVMRDLNGDGVLDVAVGTNGTTASGGVGALNVLVGKGDGTFQTTQTYAGLTGNQLIVANTFTNGGTGDILAVSNTSATTNNLLLYKGNGSGTFTAASPMSAGIGQISALITGDFNNDGKQDFIVAGLAFGVPAFNVFLGNGDGTFNSGTLNATSNVSITALAAGDFNGHGALDLAVAHSDGTIDIFLQDGVGDFYPNAGTHAGTTPTAIAIGDFNGDGNADLAVTDTATSTVSILMGAGDGTFTASASAPTGSSPTAIAVGDFNGDGNADLAVTNGGSNTVSLLFGNGNGGFTAQTALNTGTTPVSLAVGALNGSTTSDIVVADENPLSSASNSAATVLLSQLSQRATATATGIAPSGSGSHLVEASYTGNAVFTASASATTSLTGTAPTGPTAVLSASSLAFAATTVGTTSTAQMVMLSNGGQAALSITSITASAGFAETNNCGNSVAGGSSCTISVTFSPTVTGAATGSLTVSDNATAGTTQSLTLSGTGVSFAVSSGSSSLTLPASGGSTSTALSLSGAGGFSGAVNLTCAVTYSTAGTTPNDPPTCSLTPTQVQLSGSTAATSTLTVTTTPKTVAELRSRLPTSLIAFAALLGFLLVPRRRKVLFLSVLCLLAAGGIAGCGGSGSKSSMSTTTLGSYSVTVTAAGATQTVTTTIPLTVQ